MSLNRSNDSKSTYKNVVSSALKNNLGKQSKASNEISFDDYDFKSLSDVVCEIKRLNLMIESDIVKIVTFRQKADNLEVELIKEKEVLTKHNAMKTQIKRQRYLDEVSKLENNCFTNDSLRKYLFNKVSPDKIALFEILNREIDLTREEMLVSSYVIKILKQETDDLKSLIPSSKLNNSHKNLQTKFEQNKAQLNKLNDEYTKLSSNFSSLNAKRDELLKNIN